jgi:hypothetical protein
MMQWLKRRSTNSLELEVAALQLENARLKSQCQQIEQARQRRSNKSLRKKAQINAAQSSLDLLANDAYSTAYLDLIMLYEREIFASTLKEEREMIYQDMLALQRVTVKLNSMIKYASITPVKAA